MINGELIVDNFAGGGGASTGMEMATGYSVDIAINHDPEAIRMHKANHPNTKHYCEDVWQVDPVKACNGHPVGLAWFSPDCKHFSKAKGGKPKDKFIRGLAWVACRWAGLVRPRVIMLENVEEFKTWGPLNRGHHPIKAKQGNTFDKFMRQLTDLGYEVQFQELVAADYGAPTMRKRFFLIARCDGKPIVWPEPTHAPADSEEVKAGLLKPYVGAYTQLDFSLPCPSIFDTSEEIKEKYGIRAVRPLAPKTMERIARGLKKFGREFSDLEEIKERIEDEKRTIASLEEDIANPEDWDQIVHWDVNKGEYVDSYSSVDEYINECSQAIKDEKQWLLGAEEDLNDLKKDFADYMGSIAYDWDDQVEKCNKWYEENIKNLVENSSPEENNILPVQGHRRGSSR